MTMDEGDQSSRHRGDPSLPPQEPDGTPGSTGPTQGPPAGAPSGPPIAGPPSGPAVGSPPPPWGAPAESSPATGPSGRRRILVAALVAAVVLGGLGLTLSIVLGGSTSAQAEVINAVNSSLADRTAHLTLTVNEAGSGTGTLSGGVNFTEGALTVTGSANTGSGPVAITATYVGGTVYEQIPGLEAVVPGKSWIAIDLGSLTSGAQNGGTNPTAALRLAAQQGNVVTATGPSTVDGVAVQGYHVVITQQAVSNELRHAPAWMRAIVSSVRVGPSSEDLYIDGSGLLRRQTMNVSETAQSGSQGHAVSVTGTVDYSDYGSPVTVTIPPASEQISLQQFLQAEGASPSG
jgi:hypothetical protein